MTAIRRFIRNAIRFLRGEPAPLVTLEQIEAGRARRHRYRVECAASVAKLDVLDIERCLDEYDRRVNSLGAIAAADHACAYVLLLAQARNHVGTP